MCFCKQHQTLTTGINSEPRDQTTSNESNSFHWQIVRRKDQSNSFNYSLKCTCIFSYRNGQTKVPVLLVRLLQWWAIGSVYSACIGIYWSRIRQISQSTQFSLPGTLSLLKDKIVGHNLYDPRSICRRQQRIVGVYDKIAVVRKLLTVSQTTDTRKVFFRKFCTNNISFTN